MEYNVGDKIKITAIKEVIYSDRTITKYKTISENVVIIDERNNNKTIELPICYVHLIQDCLQTIKRHNLCSLLGCYDGNEDKDFLDALKSDIDDILESICKPLDDLDEDTKIIIEEE